MCIPFASTSRLFWGLARRSRHDSIDISLYKDNSILVAAKDRERENKTNKHTCGLLIKPIKSDTSVDWRLGQAAWTFAGRESFDCRDRFDKNPVNRVGHGGGAC